MAILPKINSEGLRMAAKIGHERVSSVVNTSKDPQPYDPDEPKKLTFDPDINPPLERIQPEIPEPDFIRKLPFTPEQWYSLPSNTRIQWWKETKFGRSEPSAKLVMEIKELLKNDA